MASKTELIGQASQPQALPKREGLKMGPVPREVEVIERWNRDRVNQEMGRIRTDEIHSISPSTESAPAEGRRSGEGQTGSGQGRLVNRLV